MLDQSASNNASHSVCRSIRIERALPPEGITNNRWRGANGRDTTQDNIAAPPAAVHAALTEQHHPKSSPHYVFTS